MFALSGMSIRRSFMIGVVAMSTGCAHHKSSSSSPPAPSVPLTGSNLSSADAGRAIFTSKCGDCHSIPTITGYSANQWSQTIIPSMSSKAGLSSSEKQQLTDYISSVLSASP